MVAYSFKRLFGPQIVAGLKTQTVRGHRARHARPGELVQLYQDMRTRHCLKLIPDPICILVSHIVISFDTAGTAVDWIEINGGNLHPDAMEYFAFKDGFCPDHVDLGGRTALENFARFWNASHGMLAQFEGVLIEWGPTP
jgi:hypothetical protein